MFIEFVSNSINGKRVLVQCDVCKQTRIIEYINYRRSEESADLNDRKERNLCRKCHLQRLAKERTKPNSIPRKVKPPKRNILNHNELTLRV